MKKIYFLPGFLFILFMQCAGSKVTYDYDRAADFSQYKTFNFKTNDVKGISKLEVQRILNAIRSQMEAKGFLWSDTPDVYLLISSAIQTQKKQTGNIGIGLGKWSRNIGVNLGTSVPITHKVQNIYLELEIFEARSNYLIWQGSFKHSTKTAKDPHEKEHLMNQFISELLVNFPPR